MSLSVVIPVYGSQNSLHELHLRLTKILLKLNTKYEIIFVFDQSPDDGWSIIKKICSEDPQSKGICLSRNFGQHNAITAGLNQSQNEWIVVMDCDLQDKPEEIENLYLKVMEGYDIVYAQRIIRQDSWLKKCGSHLFYKFFSYMTESLQDESIANFGIYHRKVINSVLDMHDKIRFFPAMVQWVGYKSTKIAVQHQERSYGQSSYTWKKLFNLAFDVILSFSDKPLRIVTKIGFIAFAMSLILCTLYILAYFTGHITVNGFTTLVLSIWLLSGFNIFTLGVVGLYIGRIFNQTKDRQVYVVKELIDNGI